LKLVADVGLIGYPNVGKSTLLASISAARPKIADYPFTTITPNLGVVSVGDDSFVAVDIPGLIEGAHDGKGLGLEFLRHIERTRILVHVIDGMAVDPLQDLDMVNQELALHHADLKDKPQIIAFNKMDLTEVRERWPELHKKLQKRGYTVYGISAATGQGVTELMQAVNRRLHEMFLNRPVVPAGSKVFRPKAVDGYTISKEGDVYVVTGRRAERVVETAELGNLYAFHRVLVLLRRMGVAKALAAAGVVEGDRVRFGNSEIVWKDETYIKLDARG
jgi:GTP-binding protein